MGYTRKAAFGFGWSSVHQLGSGLITAAKLALLARFIGPHEFGLASLVVIAIGVTESLTQTGVNVTIIQSPHSPRYYLNTAWVIAIIRGFLISVIVAGIGFVFSKVYAEPQLVFIGLCAASIPLIKGFINPSIVAFQKNLDFKMDTLYRLANLGVEAVATIALAFYTPTVWAFVGGMAIAALFEVWLSFTLCADKPVFQFIASRAADIMKNATGLSSGAILAYLADNLDNLLVGKLLGVAVLGGYQNAYALSHKFTYNLAYAFSYSTLPVFAKVSHERERLVRAFTRSLVFLVVLLLGLSLPFFLFPTQIVSIVFGSKWLNIAQIIPWLAAAGIVHGVFTSVYTLCITKRAYLFMNLHRILVLVTFVILAWFLAEKYDILGVAVALLASRLLLLPLALVASYRIARK